jgi:hypothetical protein
MAPQPLRLAVMPATVRNSPRDGIDGVYTGCLQQGHRVGLCRALLRQLSKQWPQNSCPQGAAEVGGISEGVSLLSEQRGLSQFAPSCVMMHHGSLMCTTHFPLFCCNGHARFHG